jgi:hypothetical protein
VLPPRVPWLVLKRRLAALARLSLELPPLLAR